MKRFAFRLAVALSTLALGLTITGVVHHRQQSPTESTATPLASVPETVNDEPKVVTTQNNNINFEAAYVEAEKLNYAGYEVERRVDADGRISSATIKKKDRTLSVLRNGGLGMDSTRFGVFPLLGQETKQLVIMQYTGGAHCCWMYKVYDSNPRLHLIFDDEITGADYLGYELQAEDLDGDGRYELEQAIMTFDYFHMSHASSVFPTAVFSYDDKSHAYVPANKKFSSYLLRDVHDDLKAVDSARANLDPENLAANESYLSAVLRVLFDYIYAGEREDGWKFFNHEFRLSNKDELRNDIEQALRNDPIYKSIYRH